MNMDYYANGGSPPYTWGAPEALSEAIMDYRITPIYMGSTLLPVAGRACFQDHPHIHGEHDHDF